MAGVSALAEARRRGIYAICVEARTKPGGRIRTVRNRRLARWPIELGAEFVHGPMMKRLCESLGLELIKHPSDGAAFGPDRGRTGVGAGPGSGVVYSSILCRRSVCPDAPLRRE